MQKASAETQQISSVSFGSASCIDLSGNTITVRLFGVIPIQTIRLADVYYLRLATKDELTMAYLFFNWTSFLPRSRTARPVYVLQTTSRRRVFLKLEGLEHFRLRKAIGRQLENERQRIAA